ncbi:uncharacterized protein [Musca autumnalis]|uniref:uncharacterized protein n=1 Tax=Musca autumnalis TaxID=221902 RepID=UPI003CF2214A
MAAYLQDRNMPAANGAPVQARRPRSRSPGSQRQQHHQQPDRSRSSQRRRQQDARRDRPSFWQRACGLCQDDHALSTCRRFLDMSPHQRYETVERRSYCRNCLARSHLAPDCTSLTSCHKCDNRHHTLLHGAPQIQEPQPMIPDVVVRFTWDLVFVPTAMVRVVAEEIETYATIRALVLQGAAMSRISYSSFRRLGLRSFLHKSRRFTTFKIMSRNTNDTWALKINALITNELPYRPYSDPIIEDPTVDFPANRLADVDPRGNLPIELELGGDTYSAISREGRMFTGLGDVYGYETALGFVISGPIKNMERS